MYLPKLPSHIPIGPLRVSSTYLPSWDLWPHLLLKLDGLSTEQEVLLSRLIEKAIRRSHALDTETLCIVAGQKCWTVRADVHFLDHDGALVDASCIAVIAALSHFKRPDVSVDGESVTIHTLKERVPVPLSLLHHPICVTFSFFDGGEVVLMDATLQEEQLREGLMTIT